MQPKDYSGWLKPGQPVSLDPHNNFRPAGSPQRPKAQRRSQPMTLHVRLSGAKLKPDERGLVIGNPIAVDPQRGSVLFQGRAWDETELRAAVLFWDRIELPDSVFDMTHPSFPFLESAGVLHRSSAMPTEAADIAQATAAGIVATFQALEQRDPGQWAMSNGENSTHLFAAGSMPDRGVLFRLANVLPVPGDDAPLEDILAFKAKRRDELILLRLELERVYQRILAAPDQPLAELTEAGAPDRAALDALKVAEESKLRFKFSDWQVNMNLGKAIALGSLAAGATSPFALPQLSAAVGGLAGVAGLFDLTASVGWRPKPSAGPYAYLVHATKDLRRA